jgi:hypothetical protein
MCYTNGFVAFAEKQRKMEVNFAQEVSLFIPVGFINTPQNLTKWDRRLCFPFEGSRNTNFCLHQKSFAFDWV